MGTLMGTIFNYRFHVGLQENLFRKDRKIYLFGAGSVGAKRCVLRTEIKTCSWKLKMKPLVKYDE